MREGFKFHNENVNTMPLPFSWFVHSDGYIVTKASKTLKSRVVCIFAVSLGRLIRDSHGKFQKQ